MKTSLKTNSKKKKNTKQNSNQNKVVPEQNINKEEEHMELENTAINDNKIRKVASLLPISKNMITKNIDKNYRFNRYINDEDLFSDPYKTEANWDIPKFLLIILMNNNSNINFLLEYTNWKNIGSFSG